MVKFDRFKIKWREFTSVLKTEYRHIFKDEGVLLVIVIAPLLYATFYSIGYGKEVLRNIPIGVIDDSHTASSRRLVEMFDASPNIYVAYGPTSMEEAKALFFDRKIYGIAYIPSDYEKCLVGGTPATVGVYVDASYFLAYRQAFADMVGDINITGSEAEFSRLVAQGASSLQAEATSDPVVFEARDLFNPYLGYGSFIMPAIILVIIQQTLLVGVGMIGGTWREYGLYNKLRLPGEKRLSTVPMVIGKSVAYLSIYTLSLLYLLVIHYRIFHYPMNGRFWTIVNFLVPYMLACIFLSITLSAVFKRRENSIMVLIWSSIPILLLSGASVPKEAIPGWLYSVGRIFPSSCGVDGFLRIQTMGADLFEVMPQYAWLWILAGAYFVTACLGMKYVVERTAAAPVESDECGQYASIDEKACSASKTETQRQ